MSLKSIVLILVISSFLVCAKDQFNIYDEPLETCSISPMTGYERTGKCETNDNDQGTHLVCAKVNDEFLEYTKSKGNDLSTPTSWFPGLKSGDNWCLCVFRWTQAFRDGFAPPVVLKATNKESLRYFKTLGVELKDLTNGSI